MPHCPNCGGRVRRIHRSLSQRFFYMAVYECRQCRVTRAVPRHFTFYFGSHPRCPRCGTFRLRQLAERDRIDPFHGGFLNWFQGVLAGSLYHCRYCRVQFYDLRRTLSPEAYAVLRPAPVSEAGEMITPEPRT